MSNMRYRRPQMLRSLSIVMPVHNEAAGVRAAAEAAMRTAAKIADTYELIIVDDSSTDATVEIAEQLASEHPEIIHICRQEHELGYGATVQRGLAATTKTWVWLANSAALASPATLMHLIPFSDQYDLVVGHQRRRNEGLGHQLRDASARLAARLLFGVRLREPGCTLLMKRTAQVGPLTAPGALAAIEILHYARTHRMRIKEVHVPPVSGDAQPPAPRQTHQSIREVLALRWQLFNNHRALMRANTRIVGLLSLVTVIGATIWAYTHGVILAYGDAESHLNIAKRVIDSLTPGYAQLGGIWLPLPHLLMIPFVINDWLWRSGIGGSIPSMIAFVWLCVAGYRLAYEITGSFKVSYIVPLVFILNPNTLYLAATPMTEILLLSLFTTSVYFFVKWLRTDALLDFVLFSFFAFLASLSRYDGWALVCAEVVCIAVYLLVKKRPYKVLEGHLVLYSFVACSGIALWFIWNKAIFGSFTYFANSVYGAKVQQQFFLQQGYLPTYHNLGRSLLYFLEDTRQVVGLPVVLLACAGVLFFTAKAIRSRHIQDLLLIGLVLTPFAFYVLSLYSGQASLLLPEFAKPGALYTLFNVRYGVQMMLAAAVFVAFLGARFKRLLPVFLAILVFQSFYFLYTGSVTTYTDGTAGLSSQAVSKGPDAPAVESYLRSHYDNGLVLMDDYRRPIGITESGIPMQAFIGSGNKPYWSESFDDPGKFAKWVIVQKSSDDAVWAHLQRKDLLDSEFVLVFNQGNLFVYEKRSPNDYYVQRSGQHLALAQRPYTIDGVNSYDLLTQPDDVIRLRMEQLADLHFNTVRLWCFNQQGTLNPQNFHALDVVMQATRRYNLRLICVLGNTLNDYGGPGYFGAATPAIFFSSQQSLARYEAHVKTLLTHIDPLTGTRLDSSPYILAWELINEPRVEGVRNSDVLMSWVNTVGQYVLSLDQSHLISPGTEGFTAQYSGQYYNEQHGASIEDLCGLEVISLCSAHLYPKYLSPSHDGATMDPAGTGAVLRTWRAIADRLDKPLYIGEVGYDLSDGPSSTRQDFLADVATNIIANRLDGGLLWDFGSVADQTYTLSVADPDSHDILQEWSRL